VSEQRGIPELAPVFRVKAARFDFDVMTGIKITVDFNNYVEATRADAGLTVTTGLPALSTSQVGPTVLAATRVER
jgi:hypothetical protein